MTQPKPDPGRETGVNVAHRQDLRQHDARVKPRADFSISGKLAGAFNLRWMLWREGVDPCDEWDVDTMLGLPDGLSWKAGTIVCQCRSCDRDFPYEGEVEEFEYDDPMNLCGGSPRCLP